MQLVARLAGVVLGTFLIVPLADAESWSSFELPSAFAVSSEQEAVFRPGAMPAVAEYMSFGGLSLGVRLRAGVLRDGTAPTGHMEDPGVGGLVTVGIAWRLALGDGWVEAVAGGGMTGRDLVPAFEAGAGWAFDFDSFSLGPSVRYVRVVAGGAMRSGRPTSCCSAPSSSSGGHARADRDARSIPHQLAG